MRKKLTNQILESKKNRPQKKLIALRMPEKLHKEVVALAKQTDSSVSSVILFLIEKGMRD